MSSVTPYDKKGMPTTTKIIGRTGDNLSESFAAKLTKRLGKQVYVSFNFDLGSMFSAVLGDIEQRLYEEISLCPDKFWNYRSKNIVCKNNILISGNELELGMLMWFSSN